jgi:hypothetical protein
LLCLRAARVRGKLLQHLKNNNRIHIKNFTPLWAFRFCPPRVFARRKFQKFRTNLARPWDTITAFTRCLCLGLRIIQKKGNCTNNTNMIMLQIVLLMMCARSVYIRILYSTNGVICAGYQFKFIQEVVYI